MSSEVIAVASLHPQLDRNAGLRGGVFQEKHRKAMGESMWLFGWLTTRQTDEVEGEGRVLGGYPISLERISGETGYGLRSLRRWVFTLRVEGYIRTIRRRDGLVFVILKAKKFGNSDFHRGARIGPSGSANLGRSLRPDVAVPVRPDVAARIRNRERSTETELQGRKARARTLWTQAVAASTDRAGELRGWTDAEFDAFRSVGGGDAVRTTPARWLTRLRDKFFDALGAA